MLIKRSLHREPVQQKLKVSQHRLDVKRSPVRSTVALHTASRLNHHSSHKSMALAQQPGDDPPDQPQAPFLKFGVRLGGELRGDLTHGRSEIMAHGLLGVRH